MNSAIKINTSDIRVICLNTDCKLYNYKINPECEKYFNKITGQLIRFVDNCPVCNRPLTIINRK